MLAVSDFRDNRSELMCCKQRANEQSRCPGPRETSLPELCGAATVFPNTASNLASNPVPLVVVVVVVGGVAAGIFISPVENKFSWSFLRNFVFIIGTPPPHNWLRLWIFARNVKFIACFKHFQILTLVASFCFTRENSTKHLSWFDFTKRVDDTKSYCREFWNQISKKCTIKELNYSIHSALHSKLWNVNAASN